MCVCLLLAPMDNCTYHSVELSGLLHAIVQLCRSLSASLQVHRGLCWRTANREIGHGDVELYK